MARQHPRGSIATMIALVVVQCLLPLASAQWIYPPPLPEGASLTDYTTGVLAPIDDYHIYDHMIASYRTPNGAFGIARCAKPGHKKPILPSNSTFASTEGHTTPDGIWEFMPIYMDTPPNRIGSGKNIWFVFLDEYVPENTDGHSICWLELYEGTEMQIGPLDCDLFETVVCPEEGLMQVITVDGRDTRNYFASTPFVVQPEMRENKANYTWSSKNAHDGSVTIHIGSEPTGNTAPGTVYMGVEGGSGLVYTFMSFLGLLLGLA